MNSCIVRFISFLYILFYYFITIIVINDSQPIRICLVTRSHARNLCNFKIFTRITGFKFSRLFSFVRENSVILGWVCRLSADEGNEASPSMVSNRMKSLLVFLFYFRPIFILFCLILNYFILHYYISFSSTFFYADEDRRRLLRGSRISLTKMKPKEFGINDSIWNI